MFTEWLAKGQRPSLILFFNGWGMTKNSIAHLLEENTISKNYDILHICNYQDPDLPQFDFSGYKDIYLIAWSMGIYMSTQVSVPFTQKIAFCGTGNPIDRKEGISPRTYRLTITSFSEKTMPAFCDKIGFPPDSTRSAKELQQELIALQNYAFPKTAFFDCAFIAENDTIFPREAQELYWCKYAKKTIHLQTKHYPFRIFSSFREIITMAKHS
jgi:biotin synthesis protein BioG